MDDNELTIYILQQLRQGVPEQSIRGILAQNGWPQPLVDRAFSMVQQARPHAVDPQLPMEPVMAMPQESELPVPSENPYPVLEGEKRREQENRLRRLLMMLLTLIVLAAIGGAIYYFFVSKDKPDTKETAKAPIAQTSVDTKRQAVVNQLASKLEAYYKARGTYPTLAQLNSPDLPHSSGGFDASKYTDPEWDSKKSACANTQSKPIFAETRSEGCISYRATAPNGGDCDAATATCTRIVITATLKDKKPFIVALDRNKRE